MSSYFLGRDLLAKEALRERLGKSSKGRFSAATLSLATPSPNRLSSSVTFLILVKPSHSPSTTLSPKEQRPGQRNLWKKLSRAKTLASWNVPLASRIFLLFFICIHQPVYSNQTLQHFHPFSTGWKKCFGLAPTIRGKIEKILWSKEDRGRTNISFSSFHSGAKEWMVGHNLDKPSHAVFLKITICSIFGLDVRRAFLDHSKLRDIDTLKFGKISYLHERPFSGKIWKFCWYNGMESESFISSWLTFEIAKYSLWTALTNHIRPNICGGLTKMSKLLY